MMVAAIGVPQEGAEGVEQGDQIGEHRAEPCDGQPSRTGRRAEELPNADERVQRRGDGSWHEEPLKACSVYTCVR